MCVPGPGPLARLNCDGRSWKESGNRLASSLCGSCAASPMRTDGISRLKGSLASRAHHLVKTFWGRREKQLPDGTLILTSPAGRTYVTTPGSALLFPSLCAATGATTSHRPSEGRSRSAADRAAARGAGDHGGCATHRGRRDGEREQQREQNLLPPGHGRNLNARPGFPRRFAHRHRMIAPCPRRCRPWPAKITSAPTVG